MATIDAVLARIDANQQAALERLFDLLRIRRNRGNPQQIEQTFERRLLVGVDSC